MAFGYVFPIAIAIVALIIIVATSYEQIIHAYPNGGGSYVVAKDNHGVIPGLVRCTIGIAGSSALAVSHIFAASAGCQSYNRFPR